MTVVHEDPLVRSARREAVVVLLLYLAALAWTVGYSVTYGYGRDPRSIQLVFGMPDWIVWGVLAPWGGCYLFSLWFGLFFVQDAELGGSPEEESDHAS